MKKILTKTLSLVLCIAFTGMQTSLAAVLTTGDFAGKNVLNGTGAVIKGHTAGLRAVETDLTNATLRFNNHTRIDWEKLNVDKGQKLYFNNGTYGVLNNVVGTSISKFAGIVTADSGKIIISNPNGMLFQGGQFTSTGSLLLTTKNLTADTYGEGYNFNELNIDNANNGAGTFQVIQILADSEGNNSVISAGDLNIISNGIQIDGAELASTMSNGVVLITADGANYNANIPNNSGLTFGTEYSYEDIANTAISTNGGTITLKSGKGGKITDSSFKGNTEIDAKTRYGTVGKIEVEGNLDVKADYLQMSASANNRSSVSGDMTFTDIGTASNTYGARIRTVDIGGKLVAKSDSDLDVSSVTVNGTTAVNGGREVRVNDLTSGSTTIDSYMYTRIYGTNQINGDLTVNASSVNMGKYNSTTDRSLVHGETNVTGTYKATSKYGISVSDDIKADKVDFTSTDSSIIYANSDNGNGSITANDIKLTAKNGQITGLNANVDHDTTTLDSNGNVVRSSDYYDFLQQWTFDALQNYSGQHVKVSGGNLTVESKGSAAFEANLTGDMNITTERGITLLDSTVAGNANLKSDSIQIRNGVNKFGGDLIIEDYTSGNAQANTINVSLNNVEVAGNLDITSPDFVRVINTKANTEYGKTTITTSNEVRVGDVQLGDTTIDATKFVRMYGNNKVNGDLNIKASQINMGTYANENKTVAVGNTTDVTGDFNANAYMYQVGISSAITAKNIDITANNGSIVTADGLGSLTAENSVKMTAKNGSIMSISADSDGTAQSDYVKAMLQAAPTNALKTLNTGNMDVKGATATLTAKDNVKVNANVSGDMNVTAGNYQDAYINLTGKVGGNLNTSVDDTHITNATVGGNVLAIDSFDNPDDTKGVTITDSTITGTLTRPNDWDNVKVTGTKAGDTTLRGSDIEVKNSNTGNLDAYTVNNITVDNLGVTGNADVVAGKTADVTKLVATGKLNVNAKDAVVTGSKGADVLIQGSNSATLNDVTATAGDLTAKAENILTVDKAVAIKTNDTNGNIYLGSNGTINSLTADTAKADTNLTVEAAGDINVSGLKADADNNNIGDLTINGANITAKVGEGANVTVSAAGTATVQDITAKAGDADIQSNSKLTATNVKAVKTNANNGNVKLASNSDVDVNGATADKDVRVTGRDITANGLTADAENNTIGDVYVDGRNTTLTNSKGANVTEIATGKAVAKDVTAKAGNVDIRALADTATTAEAENVTANAGNVTIQANNKVTAKNITATKSDETNGNIKVASRNSDVEFITANAQKDIEVIANNGAITAKSLKADSEENGIGDLKINGKSANVSDSEGANATIVGVDSLTLTNVTAHAGNISGTSNGVVTANTLKAVKTDDTNGNIYLGSKTKVDAKNADADTNITIASEGDAIADKMVADFDNNGVGKLTINGVNTTLTNSEGASVEESAANTATATNVTAKSGNALIEATNTTTADTVSATAGNVTIKAGGKTTAKNVTATKSDDTNGNIYVTSTNGDAELTTASASTDITVTANNGTATAKGAKADSENNGVGNLTVRGKKAVVADSEGANVTVRGSETTAELTNVTAKAGDLDAQSQGNLTATNVKAVKVNETKGNIKLATNGNANVTTANADTNVEITANAGNVVASGLKADFENNTIGDIIINTKNVTLTDSEGAGVSINANGTADLTNVTAKAGDLYAAATGKITAEKLYANKVNETKGNIILGSNSDVKLTTANADTNIEITGKTVEATGLKADFENNTIGDIIINSNKTTLTSSQGAGVKVDAVDTADLTNVTANAGDIEVEAGNNVTADTVKALKRADETKGNIKLTSINKNVDVKKAEAQTNVEATATNGTVIASGTLTADTEGNSIGDVILTGKYVQASNGKDIGTDGIIKGANVTINQSTAVDTYTAKNLVAVAGNDNAGDVTINVPTKNIVLNEIYATKDVVVDNRPADAEGILETATLTKVYADSEENGVGEINIKTRGQITATDVAGANITLESINGNIKVDTAKSVRADQPDTAGNVKLIADNGNIEVGNVNAATDIIGNAENGNINVTGNLTADYEPNTALGGNGVGDVILSAKKLDGDNFTKTDSTIAIKGANVELNQSTPQDTLVLSNITADGKGNDAINGKSVGNVDINIPVKNVDLNNIHATRDITVDNGTTDGILDSAKLTTVIADSEENGIGDLNIKTKNDITAKDIAGANITLESTNGNITVDGAKSARGNQADADAGNITIIADNNGNADDKGNITLGNIHADTDVVGDASKGNINQTGDIVADNEGNGVGEVKLTAKDGMTLGDNGIVKGADITLEVGNGDIDVKNLIADGQVYDENGNVIGNSDDHGNISIHTPNGNVTVDDTTGTHDVTIVTDNGKATVTDTAADSEENGKGTLTIKATGDVVATNDEGANVVVETKGDIDADNLVAHAPGAGEDGQGKGNGNIILTSEEGNIDLNGAKADHDIVVTPGKDADGKYIGDAKVNNAHADADNDKDGDLIINGKNVTVNADVTENPDGTKTVTPTGDNSTGNNVIINAGNDVVAEDIKSNDDIIITAGNDVIGNNLIADAENPNTADSDGIGDLIINAKGDVDLTKSEGNDVDITAGGDVNAKDITAKGNDGTPDNPTDKGDLTINAGGDVNIENTKSVKDTEITSGGDVTVKNAKADTDNDGQGDLIIHGKGNIDVDGGEGSNVEIKSDNGDIDVDNIHAHGTDDGNNDDDTIGQGDGNIKIDAPNGKVTIDDSDATNDIIIKGKDVIVGPNVKPDIDGNDVGRLIVDIIPGGSDIDTGLDIDDDEVIRNLNNLVQRGIDTQIAQSFTPIAFAAGDDEDDALLKKIVKTVFKTPETGIVTITEKYKSMR